MQLVAGDKQNAIAGAQAIEIHPERIPTSAFLASRILNYEFAHQRFPPATGLGARVSELSATTDSYSGFLSILSFTSRYPRVTYDREVERDGSPCQLS